LPVVSADLGELEARIGHPFADRGLLIRALTHKSRVAERDEMGEITTADNEQFEFLGDAVLGFLASDVLVMRRPDLAEGQLSKLKAHLVSAVRLHAVAQRLGIGDFLRLGKGEELSGGREKKALLANAIEALLAAMYRDGGVEPCRRFVENEILGELNLDTLADAPVAADAKSALQEFAQARGLPLPRYVVVREHGPEHAKAFTVEARIGRDFAAQGEGTSKKNASQRAAERLLHEIQSLSETGP
jgi:ribonuclease III